MGPTIEQHKQVSSSTLRFCGENDSAIRENKKLVFPFKQSSKSRIAGKIRYWWCWFVAAFLLLVLGVPSLLFLWAIRRRLWLYPIALFGAELWLRACGAHIKVNGFENLAGNEQFVFISNHRSYLDTAALFRYTGKRIGLVAKKELLKAPILGQGMGFVNVIAIDRSNPEKARLSMEKARKVMEDGYSFGVFAEGTRAMPGELLPFKKGAFHLALQTNSRIIPVAFKNSDVLMGKKAGVLFTGTIEMTLLPPVETKGRDVMELLRETRHAIADNLSEPPAQAAG